MLSCTLLTAPVGREHSWQQATSHHVYLPASVCRGDEEAVGHLTYPIALLTALLYPLTSSLPLFDARMQYMIAY